MQVRKGLGRAAELAKKVVTVLGVAVAVVVSTAWPVSAQQIEISPSSDGLPGGELLQKIVNWAGQIGIYFVIISFVVGAGAWALGGFSGNPQTAARGQKAVGVAVMAAILLGGAAAILNLFYEAGGTIS